jgi:hypothetical protein
MKYVFFFILLVCFSCAQFVPPTGGKRDTTPPKTISTFPLNKSKNVSTQKLELTFDELIDVSSLKQDLLIIPQPKGLYTVKEKGKTIVLNFDEPFEKNTTYTFNFRNGIKDLNEKNPASNLKLVFSTGAILDSLSISGLVRDIQTKTPVLNSTVALYKLDTTPIIKRKPDYFIKTDSAGKFNIENVKPNTYALQTYTDLNNNLRYDQKTEKFAYVDTLINLQQNLTLPALEIYQANYTPNKIKKTIPRDKEFIIQLDKPAKSVTILQDSLDYFLRDKLNFVVFKTDKIKVDTSKITFVTTDSLNVKDTLKQKVYFSNPPKNYKISTLSINSNIKNNSYQTADLNYLITFDFPIKKIDINKIIFKTDTLLKEKPSITWPNKNTINLLVKTKALTQTELIFLPKAFTNIKGDTSAYFNIKNNILQAEELGSIAGFYKSAENKIVQLLDAETLSLIKEQTNVIKTVAFENIMPGTYLIKTIYDLNKNNIWDAGNQNKNTQPETINIFKETIKLKSNFEIKNLNLDLTVDKPVEQPK